MTFCSDLIWYFSYTQKFHVFRDLLLDSPLLRILSPILYCFSYCNFILTRSLVDLFPIDSSSELPFSFFHVNFTISFLVFVSKQCWFLEDCAECIGFSEERIYFITLNPPIYKSDKTLHFWPSSIPFNKL